MNKLICTILLFGATSQLFGQSCANLNSPTAISDACASSPFLCGNYLANYCGTNAGLSDDAFGQSSGFLRLSPCDDAVELQLSVTNCAAGGTGLVFELYPEGCTPGGALASVTVSENTTETLSAPNLDALENYMLAISGVQGSQCEFNIQALDGIGTALPGPVTCSCSIDSIEGPVHILTKDTFTYSIDMPNCFLGFGLPVGGNGEFCPPPSVCPASFDSIVVHWQIPSVMHFIGDSTGLTIMVQLNDDYHGLDTIRLDSIRASWHFVSKLPTDPFSFCECSTILCVSDTGNVLVKHIIIGVDDPNGGNNYSCTLTCAQPSCEIDGIIYDTPGVYTYESGNGEVVVVTITEEDATPSLQNKTICTGGSTLLVATNIKPDYTYQWSTGATGTFITVAPLVNTTYTVTAIHDSGNCQFSASANVAVTPHTIENLGEIGVLSCTQPCLNFQGNTYCQAGSYTVQTGLCSEQTFSIGTDPTLTQITLTPVTICQGTCYDFFGQQICTSTTVTHLDNCTNYTQQVTVEQPDTVNLGVIGTLTCSQPCFNYQGIEYCVPGQYLVPNVVCGAKTFQIVFEKENISLGQIGKITCTQSCVDFEGTAYCQPGTYTLTDSCTIRKFNIGIDTIAPVCSAMLPDCLPNNTHFTVAFSITGLPPFKVDGVTLQSNYFLSAPQPNGVPYAFIVQHANGCQSVVSGIYDCAQFCITNAGKLSAETLHGCAGQSSVEVQSIAAAMLAPGDVVDFTLQDANGLVLAHNNTGVFDFDPATMIADEPYFAIRTVGPPDATGIPDLANACTDTSSSQPVIFHNLPDVTLSGDSSLCEGNTLILTASGAITYLWEDGSTGAIREIHLASPDNSGSYAVVGADQYGCTEGDSTSVNVRPKQSEGCCKPQLPNAFTPNGDGANDSFTPILPDCKPLQFAEMRVYSRWGELVFKSLGHSDRWDGTTPNGSPAGSDTYVFTFRYRLEGDEEQTQKGEVTLLR